MGVTYDANGMPIRGPDPAAAIDETGAPVEFEGPAPETSRFHGILNEIAALHDRKGDDYGTDTDPLANVRTAEEYGLPAWVGVQIRLDDKRSRIQKAVRQLLKKETITMSNESLRDSLLDRAVYSVIALVLFDETRGGDRDPESSSRCD